MKKREIFHFIWCLFGGVVLGFFIMCRTVGYFTGSVVLDNTMDKVFSQLNVMSFGGIILSFLFGVSIWRKYGKQR